MDVYMPTGTGRISYFGFDIPEIRGIYLSPNRFGFIAAAGSFLSIYFLDMNDPKNSIIPIALFSFNLTGLLLSGSRSSYLGIFVALSLLFAYYTLKRPGLRVAIIGLILSATGVTLAILGYFPGWEGLGPNSLTHRVGVWNAAISATLERPLTGWGFTSTVETIGPYLPENFSKGYSTHNSYLRIFVSGGLISGVAYILFISTICYWGTNVNRRQDLFALCTASLFLTIHIFEIPTIFGPSMPSMLAGIPLGYVYFNNVDPMHIRSDHD
jgi:O-antigen ligase